MPKKAKSKDKHVLWEIGYDTGSTEVSNCCRVVAGEDAQEAVDKLRQLIVSSGKEFRLRSVEHVCEVNII